MLSVDQDRATPLHLAAHEGHFETVQALIDGGSGLEAQTVENRTPLHMAASEGHAKAVVVLLAAGANVDERAGEVAHHLWGK